MSSGQIQSFINSNNSEGAIPSGPSYAESPSASTQRDARVGRFRRDRRRLSTAPLRLALLKFRGI